MSRFAHVSESPEARYGEHYYEKMVALGAETSTILDFGCQDGVETEKLLMLKPQKVIGVDPSESAIYEAQKKFGARAEFRVMDPVQLDFPDSRFDLIVGRSFLSHLDFEGAVRELKRVLRYGGMAVFLEPLRQGPLSRLQIEWADAQFGQAEHCFFDFLSAPVAAFTSVYFASPDNVLTRLARRLDRFLSRTPARYWMRSVVLVWKQAK